MSAKPIYLLSGGGPGESGQMIEDYRMVFNAFDTPNPNIAYVGAANHDNKLFFQFMKKPMTSAGAGEIKLVHISGKHTDAAKAKNMLSEADIIFLSGGEVEDGIVDLKRYGLDECLTGLYEAGKPFIGVSAGAIMMGSHWVHWDKEGDDNTASLFSCLNFVPMLFDAHGENEGWKELKCALRLLGPGAEGYGLSRGGFFRADPGGRLTSFRNGPDVFRNVGGAIQPAGTK